MENKRDVNLAGMHQILMEQLVKLKNARDIDTLEREILRADAMSRLGLVVNQNAKTIIRASEMQQQIKPPKVLMSSDE